MTDYKNKNILITGASKGLGNIAANAFGEAGARLYLSARSQDRLEAVRAELPNSSEHLIFPTDLNLPENSAAMVDDLLQKFGPPDAIIHCMGGGLGMHDKLLTADQLETLFRTNVGSGAEINRLLLPKMVDHNGGYVVHVGSTASTEAIASVGYNTVKAALSSYVRGLGREFASTNVVVTGILPGAFYAPENSWRRLEKNKPEIVEKFVEDRLPRGKIADAEEIIPLLFLLTSDGASMMAGTCVAIDAGESTAYAHLK